MTFNRTLTFIYQIQKKVARIRKFGRLTIRIYEQVGGITSNQVLDLLLSQLGNRNIVDIKIDNTIYRANEICKESNKESHGWSGNLYLEPFTIFFGSDGNDSYAKLSIIEEQEGILGDVSSWINIFTPLEGFTQAYLCDSLYSTTQNEPNIDNFKLWDIDPTPYSKKENTSSAPFTGEIIDVEKNPGRVVNHQTYIEVVASPIWFGQGYWKIFGEEKKREILSSNLVKCREFNGILEAKALDGCINNTTPVQLQDDLRKLFYGKNEK